MSKVHMKYAISLLVFAALSGSAGLCQDNKLDSLKNVLAQTQSDTAKINVLSKIVNYYKAHSDFNTALSYAKTALDIAKSTKDLERVAHAQYNVALAYLGTESVDTAISFAKLAEEYYSTHGPKSMLEKAYNEMGTIYSASRKYTNAIEYYTKSIVVARELKDTLGMQSVFELMGQECERNGLYRLAIDNYSKSLDLAIASKNYHMVENNHVSMGNLYGIQGIYSSALEEYFAALKVNSDQLKSERGEAIISADIGNIYNEHDTGKAMKYYGDAIKIFQKMKDEHDVAILLGNIGNMYMEAGDYKKAEDYQSRSEEKLSEEGDKERVANCYTNMGELYGKIKDYHKAIDYYQKALEIQEPSGDSEAVAYTLSGLSRVCLEKGDYKKSEEAGIRSFNLSKKINLIRMINEEGKILSDLYEKTNQPEKAFYYYKQYIAAKDSMDNKQMAGRMIKAELSYEYDQKQQAEKLEDEKREALNTEKAHHEKIVRNVYLGAFVIVFLLTILLLRNLLRVRTANKIITEQKAEVEQQKGIVDQKNRDITDSINYAKRIQQAMLPTIGQWDHFFKESFIYYRPKDIVSGDFYWCMGIGNDVVVSVADCTGHGVPGAFMSMLGISSLNKIVGEQHIKQPGKILNALRDEIIKSLNPEGKTEEVKDGMDMTLCYISPAAGTLEYAAANNPLWIIRREKQEYKVIELDADKMPVGKYLEERKEFSSKKVEIKKGDRVYLFTDGYADQFGGEKGKKFKYRHLQELLLSWQGKNMQEQRTLLEKSMKEWKGNLEQVDDILVAGIEVV